VRKGAPAERPVRAEARGLLAAVCSASGGGLSPPGEPHRAIEGLAEAAALTVRTSAEVPTRREAIPPAATAGAFLACLVALWSLRRAWGLA
jgi:hypothetical protein